MNRLQIGQAWLPRGDAHRYATHSELYVLGRARSRVASQTQAGPCCCFAFVSGRSRASSAPRMNAIFPRVASDARHAASTPKRGVASAGRDSDAKRR